MGSCKKCGICCEMIVVKWSLLGMRELTGPDPEFILKNWKPIAPEVAAMFRSSLRNKADWLECNYFVCRFYDYKGKLCKIQEEKSPVCANFPHYGELFPKYDTGMHCGFYEDWLEGQKQQTISKVA